MAKHSITAVFDTRQHAEQAVTQLKASGVPASDVTSLPAAGESTAPSDPAGGQAKGFWGSLEQLFGGTADHATYAESIRRGGVVVSVRAEDAEMDRIVDILEQNGSVDLDERESTWRSEGWSGGAVTSGDPTSSTTDRGGLGLDSPGMTAMATTHGADRMGTAALGAGAMTVGALGAGIDGERREAGATEPTLVTDRAVADRVTVPSTERMRDDAGDVIQVVEERLDVGKRSVNRGKVRVHTSVVSREVSEDISLHDETVTVDRRRVDRPLAALASGLDPFQERTIEMEEYAEEAVVAKSAHVVEEIGIRKDAADHVETVRETLRSTRVDIEDGRGGTSGGGAGRLVGEIRDDMEVVGSDGAHVGTVDHMDGGRIKLKKIDPAAGGTHHYLEPGMVASVAGKVMLAMTAAEARARWATA